MSVIENSGIKDANLRNFLSEKYLSYALSTIMHRALPDVRDGLKPVHRRLLYAMRILKLNPNSPFKKSARVVGDVIGKYHPHGDKSVYDALVRLTQEFSVRYPLIDGQGNFGNIDGDNAAAMRYTEARLTAIAELLLDGLDEDTVDFRPNYDGSEDEPVILPSAFPNLLANGSSGIAVGMATNIPPHNVGELCEGLIALLDNPDITHDALMQIIPGPDFPTGGTIIEPHDSIAKTYEAGRGSIRLRAKYILEDLGRGQYQIIVIEIPYMVQKSRLIEKIASLIDDKKIPLLGDIRDESSDDLRIVFEPKSKNVDPELLMETLFKITDLENRFALNMNVLSSNQVPMVMPLKQVLNAFLEHRIIVLKRRNQYRLDKIDRRLHLLDGFLIAYLNIDEVIRIIRQEDHPKQVLIKQFGLSDEQAEAILNLKLRSLAKIEEYQLKTEHQSLCDEKQKILDLLASPQKQKAKIVLEIKQVKNRFGAPMPNGNRRTNFAQAPIVDLEAAETALISKEPITIICSQNYWIRAAKGHLDPEAEIKYREGDDALFRFHALTTDKVILFASNGRSYTLNVDKLPSIRSMGDSIRMIIDLPSDASIINMIIHSPQQKILVASIDGKGYVTTSDDMLAQTKTGKQILTGETALICKRVNGDTIACVGDNRKMIIFPISQIAELSKGKGVILQKYKQGGLSDVCIFEHNQGLTWSGRINIFKDYTDYETDRAAQGKLVPRSFPNSQKFK